MSVRSARRAARRIGEALAAGGWKVRLRQRDAAADAAASGGWMVAAKKGAAHKLGYIAAHGAIVLICLGGLFDGDLFVRALTWFGGKSVYTGGGLVADVPPSHRLPENNPAFRGNLAVPEGAQSSTAILSQSDGILLQELPFAVELKKFIVEYYDTGMPRLFASEIVIHDKETGARTPTRVEVNHPASYRGVQIYQSSFDDGGSRVKLRGVPLAAGAAPIAVEGTIGGSTPVTLGGQRYTLEYSGLRVINVENMAGARGGESSGSGADVRKVDLGQALERRLGAADKSAGKRVLRNVGPSVSYKLRDAAGQAREFNNYMLPVDTGDGQPVFLLGVRDTPAEPFRYLRVPADEDGSLDDFTRLQAALHDPAARARAVARYVQTAVPAGRPDLAAQLAESAGRALGLFAGAEPVAGKPGAGLQAVSDFIEQAVPEAERERAADVLLRILNGTLFELQTQARQAVGKPPLPEGEATQRYMTQAVLALSDAPHYPAPLAFELADFTQVQASVFQVARTPGKKVVYLGCLLLILGVFAMLYVRERRVWVWLAASPEGGCSATMALSSNRQMLDTGREFEALRAALLDNVPQPAGTSA